MKWDKMGVDELLKKAENIGNQLKNYTEKLVFSFADINNYNYDGIKHNKCVDDDLMIKLFSNDKALMDFLGVEIVPPDMFNPNGVIKKPKTTKTRGNANFAAAYPEKIFEIFKQNHC
jgi:hypothetical protein